MTRSSDEKTEVTCRAQIAAFIKRAIAVGIRDLESLTELVPDPATARSLLKAADHNPVHGRHLTVDDLVQEMERRAATTLEDVEEQRSEDAVPARRTQGA